MSEDKPIRGRGRPRADNSALPLPFMDGLRWVWRRPEVENFRRVLAGLPAEPVETSADDELVSITQLAAELGVARRTVTRRVDAAMAEKAKAAKASARAAKPKALRRRVSTRRPAR